MDQNNELPVVSQPVADVAPVTPSEKMVPQSKVDEIVRHSNARVAEKARNEAVDEYKRSSSQNSQPASVGGMSSVTPEQIRSIIAEEHQKYAQSIYDQSAVEQANRTAQEFLGKLNTASDLYPDFKDTVSKLPFSSISHVVGLANESENTAEVMYELAKNPLKMANINSLAQLNPDLARTEMNKLAASIKLNAEAKNAKLPNSPLTQIKSSPVNTDSGSMSVKDFRKVFRA